MTSRDPRAPRDDEERAAEFVRDRQINVSRPSAVDPHGDGGWPFLRDLLLVLSLLPVAGIAELIGGPLLAIAAAAAWVVLVLRWRRRRDEQRDARLAAARTPRACPVCDDATFAERCPACGTPTVASRPAGTAD